MTPEGRVKKIVDNYLTVLNNVLTSRQERLYVSKFVPTGYGRNNTLDYSICLSGHFVAIETKAPGEWLSPLQRQTVKTILEAGGTVFIISGPEGLDAFKRWVDRNVLNWFPAS